MTGRRLDGYTKGSLEESRHALVAGGQVTVTARSPRQPNRTPLSSCAMIKGIGTDIVEVSRVEGETARHGPEFLQQVFTAAEIEYCERRRRKYESYAARFAAKEAFFKALGTGGRDGITWQEIEIVLDGRGRPDLALRGRAKELADERGVTGVHVSLSHSRELAAAVVVLEAGGEPSYTGG